MEPSDSSPAPPAPNSAPDQEPASSPEPAVSPMAPAVKKSRTKAFIIGGIVVVLVALAIGAYFLYRPSKQADTASTSKTTSAQPKTTDNQAVNDAASVLTDGSNSETSLTSTDDSADADSASQSAATVGDSVDENNF